LPNEFKLFVPQAAKQKKATNFVPNFGKSNKENNATAKAAASANENKSEVLEVAQVQEASAVDNNNEMNAEEIVEEDEENINESVNVA
jgi:PhoPQ-activated pathogenicity-related protein